MKRLLAYLFIVLGLGLTFSVNSWAPINLVPENLLNCAEGDCTNSVGKYIDKAGNIHTGRFINNKLVAGKREVTTGKYKGSVYVGKFVGYGNLVYGYSKIIQKLNSGDTSVHEEYVSRARVISQKNKNAFKIEVDKKIKELYLIDIDKTQYACLVRGKYVKENFVIKIVDLIKTQELDTCEHKIYRNTDRNLFEKLKNVKLDIISEAEVNKIISSAKKTQIAKAEPSQTQKVAQLDSHLIKPNTWVYFVSFHKTGGIAIGNFFSVSKFDASHFLNNEKSMKNYKFDKNDKLFKYKRNLAGKSKAEYFRISEKIYKLFFRQTLKKYEKAKAEGIKSYVENYKPKILKDLIDEYTEDNELKEGLLAYFNQEKPTIKPKKKVKVAKVEEPKQEEFKPKKTNQDNEAPVIQIAETITVNSQAYTLKGKVKDKSQVYLTIDGRQVDVKRGKFELDRFNIDPDVAENIKIVAIDKWNNKSEKTIKVTIDLQSADIAKVYEELKPNNVKVRTDNNKIAIIIGIEKYENLTNLDAKYANRDAKAFRTYATRALGIKPSNIKVLIDDKANRGNTLEAFKIWLPKIAGKGGKDIHIFFAGHGLASDNGKDLYILPQDGNAKLLDDTAITRVELISLIQKVNPKSVTMFFDTCYSGQTRDERMLVASLLRPIQIISEEQDTPDNFTIFSASDYDQVSGGIEEAKHGMFSYYLMKGLEGYADENKDKKITNGELIAYLKDNVSEEAFTQNREQDPMLVGDSNKVLMSYR
jgi:hypothetical protein